MDAPQKKAMMRIRAEELEIKKHTAAYSGIRVLNACYQFVSG